MSIQEYLYKMKEAEDNLVSFLEENDDIEINYKNIIQFFDKNKFKDDIYELNILLCMISKISNNHYRVPNFFQKIER